MVEDWGRGRSRTLRFLIGNKHPDEGNVRLIFEWLESSGYTRRNKIDVLGRKIISICLSRITDTQKMELLVLVRDRMAAKDGGLNIGSEKLLYTHQHRCINQYLEALGHHRAREMEISYDRSDPWNMVRQGDHTEGCGGGVRIERCYAAPDDYSTKRRCLVCGGFISLRHHSEPFVYNHLDAEGADDEELGHLRGGTPDELLRRKNKISDEELVPQGI